MWNAWFSGTAKKGEGREEVDVDWGVGLDTLSPVAKLWLASVENPSDFSATDNKYRNSEELGIEHRRSVTRSNVVIAARLWKLLWRDMLVLIASIGCRRTGFDLLRRLIKGLVPASYLFAKKEMLDMVQRSFETDVSSNLILRTALRSMALAAGEKMFWVFTAESESKFEKIMAGVLGRKFYAAQMSLSLITDDTPYAAAMLTDAHHFCGSSDGLGGYGQSAALFPLLHLFTQFIELSSQLSILLGTIATGYGHSHFTIANLLLIALSLAPSALRILEAKRDRNRNASSERKHDMQGRRRREGQISYMSSIATNATYKQELLIFQLRDWILGQWVKVQQEETEYVSKGRTRRRAEYAAYDLGRNSVETVFYAILATRFLPASISLGTIEMYQSAADSMLRTVQQLSYDFDRAYQSIFRFAAYVESTTDPDALEMSIRLHRNRDIPLISYETVRLARGMKITLDNLNYTYPGSSTPALKNLNLVIEPGETLAVVGVNGGGKTTLIKVLMGLYGHQGQLYINDRYIESLDPRTLYRRTSCLFQDFKKYYLSLRQNVGIGDTFLMQDDEQLVRAMERGGAQGIHVALGMDRELSPSYISKREMHESSTPSTASVGTGVNGTVDGGEKDASAAGTPATKAGSPKSEPPVNLSGGQWQRVALSRAFLRADQADLIVFDEPSSALDPKAEADLFQRIHDLSGRDDGLKPTTVFVSHRFSTVKRADRILVMEGGSIAELGTHDELMALDGKYAEMFNLQKQGFV